MDPIFLGGAAAIAVFFAAVIGGVVGAAIASPLTRLTIGALSPPVSPPPPVNLLNQTDLFDLECRVRRLENIERRRDLGVR